MHQESTSTFMYIIPFFSCDISQSSFEIQIKIWLIFPRQNEDKRRINTTLGGVLHTSSQNKKQIFSRQTHVSKNCGNTTAILLSKTEKK